MRNPNGYGSVVKLSGNRRRPYCARKTAGYNEKGHPIYKPIGYYAKREEALVALAAYNGDPYDLDMAKITMRQLYEWWAGRDFPKMPKATASAHKSAFAHCAALHDRPYRSIRAFEMQGCIDGCGLGYATQGGIKSLFAKLDIFAKELDVPVKQHSALIHAAPAPPTSKNPFTGEEIDLVWRHAGEPLVDTILILIYSGWRINELLSMECKDVDLGEGWYKGGLKTRAGRNRVVPIHDLVYGFVAGRVAEGGGHLINHGGRKVGKGKYYQFWNGFMERHGMSHTPHDARHTFRSLLDSAGANKVCIDRMMGHSSPGVGERVYTHKTIEELRRAISLVTRANP
jgi:hypothetical protein